MQWSKAKHRSIVREVTQLLFSEITKYKPEQYAQLKESGELDSYLESQTLEMVGIFRSYLKTEKCSNDEAWTHVFLNYLPNTYYDDKLAELGRIIDVVVDTWYSRLNSDEKIDSNKMMRLKGELNEYAGKFYKKRIVEKDIKSMSEFEAFAIFYVSLKVLIDIRSELIQPHVLQMAIKKQLPFIESLQYFRKMPRDKRHEIVDLRYFECHDYNLFLFNFLIARGDLQTIDPAPKRVPSTDEYKAYKDFHRYRRVDEASIPGFISYLAKLTLENPRPRKLKKKEETNEGPKKSRRLKFIREAVMRGLIEQNRHGGPKRKGRANLSAIAKIIADRYDTSCSHETVKLHIKSLGLLELAKLVPSEH